MFSVSKYKNRKTNGYDSKKEAGRAYQLRILAQAGNITNLREQVDFVLQDWFRCNGKAILPIKYRADFVYEKDGRIHVEDTKGFQTAVYLLKRKLFLRRYPDIVFLET